MTDAGLTGPGSKIHPEYKMPLPVSDAEGPDGV